MSKASFPRLVPISLLLLGMAAVVAHAAGLKAGLWETKILKQVVDGRDMTAQYAANAARMQQVMANLPPDQRARMQSMPGFGAHGTMQMCVSPEMAKRDQPMIDKDSHCAPSTFKRDGNVMTYEFNCTSNGNTRQGKGESTYNGDVVTNRIDMTTQKADGQTHTMHLESEMHYLGPDCGSVKAYGSPPK